MARDERLEATRSRAVEVIETYRSRDLSRNLVAFARLIEAARIWSFLTWVGFPAPDRTDAPDMARLVFQEANYDDIGWTDQGAALRQLEADFELDCMFRNGGRTRRELSGTEFAAYVAATFARWRTLRQNGPSPD